MDILINEKQYNSLKNVLSENYMINEAQWYNTLGDIVGIFDPSGVVDFVNGISYLKQGDTVFGILSMISVFPYLGDLAAKPLLFLGKGSKIIRNAEYAQKLAKMGKVDEATKILTRLGETNKLWRKLTNSVDRWGPALIAKVKKVPSLVLPFGLKNVIIDWIKLIFKTNSGSRAAGSLARSTTKRLSRKPGAQLTQTEAENIAKQMADLARNDQRLFLGLGGKPKGGMFSDPKGYAKWSWESFKKYPFSGGVGRLWGNRQTRALMRKTKWWLGFLDFIGLANFVGPDELEKQMGDYSDELNQYSQTREAQSNWNDDFGNLEADYRPIEEPSQQQSTPPQSGKPENKSVFSTLFPGLF